ncbi:MAG: metal-dependent transcriptional regulator [Pseudomonadota bacterium]
MGLSNRADEILETLWVRFEQTGGGSVEVGAGRGDEAIEELRGAGLVTADNTCITLTERGHKEAARAIRRHRLAERLMVDVLDMSEEAFCEMGCRFEHLLQEGVEESVCTLLGHPVVCPHGKPIPPGACCKESRRSARKLLSPLSSMEAGEAGRVAYINAHDSGHMEKLLAMGVLPGMALKMIQTFPSFVFQVGQTQYAVDRELADCVYVRLSAPACGGKRRRWGGRLPFGGGGRR